MNSIFPPYPQATPPHPHSMFFSDWDGEHAGFAGLANMSSVQLDSIDVYQCVARNLGGIGAKYSYIDPQTGNQATFTSDHCTNCTSCSKETADVASNQGVTQVNVWTDPNAQTTVVTALFFAFGNGTGSLIYGTTSDAPPKTFSFSGQILLALNGFLVPPSIPGGISSLAALGCVFGPPSTT